MTRIKNSTTKQPFALRAGRQLPGCQSVSMGALLVLALSGSNAAYAQCITMNGVSATGGSTCTSAESNFESGTLNPPIRSSAGSSLTITAPDVTAEVLPSTPGGNRSVVIAHDATVTIDGNLTGILNGQEGTGQMLRSIGSDASIVVNGDTRLVTTKDNTIVAEANQGSILFNGDLTAVAAGPTGASDDPAIAFDRGLRATNGATIEVTGATTLEVQRRAIEANGTEGSLVKLNDLTSTSGSFGIVAMRTNNAVMVTGDQVNINVTGNNTAGIVAGNGGNVFIDTAGGDTNNGNDSVIVYNTAGASVVTSGDQASGLLVRNEFGDARIEVDAGSIETGAVDSGVNSTGAYALIIGGSGVAQVDMNGGSITTHGDGAAGIVAQVDNRDASSIDNDAMINLNGGSVTTEGDGAAGLLAQSDPMSAGNATINQSGGTVTTSGAGELEQQSHGIVAKAMGTGTSTINQTGGTVSTSGAGSNGLYGYSAGGDVVINQGPNASVTASGENASAIVAEAVSADQTYTVNVAGQVSGGSGEGAAIKTGSAASGTVNIASSATVGALSGVAIVDDSGNTVINNAGTLNGDIKTQAGDDQLNLMDASTTNGQVLMGAGSDSVMVSSGANIAGISLFDGGDGVYDNLNASTDTLTFSAGDRTVDSSILDNWEKVVLDAGANVNLSSSGLTVGGSDDDTELGLIISQGSMLTVSDPTFTLTGDVNNHGTINLQNSSAGDTFVVATNPEGASGDYNGQDGSLMIDTVLGDDNSATDKLVVTGDTSGSTSLSVNNVGGEGAQTTNGIEVVEVGGASNGDFTLNGDFVTDDNQQAVVGGAYAYTLNQNQAGDWVLESTLQTTPVTPGGPVTPITPTVPTVPRYSPTASLYQQYGQALLDMNGLPTMQQRVGNRYWNAANANAQTSSSQAYDGDQGFIENGASWVRVEGSHQRSKPNAATIDTDSVTNRWEMQAGLDALLNEDSQGNKLIGGVTAHYGTSASETESFFGDGNIDTRGYGMGLTLTWLQQNGVYIDTQASATWYKTDIDSDSLDGQLASDNDGFGYAFSVEGGQQIELNHSLTITPQAQVTYSHVDFDSFTDSYNTDVSLNDADSLRSRIGVSLDHDSSWMDDTNKIRRSHVYAISNLYYEFLDSTEVDVSGVKLSNRPERLWTGLGVGGSYNFNEDKISLYGEVSLDSTVNNFGDSTALNGSVGLRAKF